MLVTVGNEECSWSSKICLHPQLHLVYCRFYAVLLLALSMSQWRQEPGQAVAEKLRTLSQLAGFLEEKKPCG
ncbi:unnamed protein product [Linum tenue]|uniref:Uncharacterized protein n=1 Tax=Linum tenue TaxID=586396 RepID=A0AAV0KX21_9ROSI|nr:unnamed protein product [Linum tenue]